jgi:hypothetical protein
MKSKDNSSPDNNVSISNNNTHTPKAQKGSWSFGFGEKETTCTNSNCNSDCGECHEKSPERKNSRLEVHHQNISYARTSLENSNSCIYDSPKHERLLDGI